MARMKVDTSVEGIKKNYDVKDEVVAALKAEGLTLPERPKNAEGELEEAILPPDLTVLTSTQMGQINTRFTAYADYVSGKLSMSEHDLLASKKAQEGILAKLRYIKDGEHVVDRSDQAKVDPQYLEADRTVVLADCRFQLITAVMSRCNKDLKLISREITRRQQEIDRSIRDGNLDLNTRNLRRPKNRFGPR